MNLERDQPAARALFDELVELDSKARARRLDDIGARQPELRAYVEALLQAADDDSLRVSDAIAGAAHGLLGERSLAGTEIGPYRLRKEVGRGGMGVVFLADRADGQFEQQVALKLLDSPAGGPDGERRFAQERDILARLRHPSIAQIHDGGVTTNGRLWFAMELVDGLPLDEYADSKELSAKQRVELVLQVLEALQSAHRQLVVHRDLKPSNILVTEEGHVKLLDFGIAKVLQEAPGRHEETGPIRVLTPRFASPEHLAGEPVSTTADVYQVGVLLYLLLSGRPPFGQATSSLAELERAVRLDDPPAPSQVARSEGSPHRLVAGSRLSADLDAIVLTALRKEPDRRYGSAEELAEELRRALASLPVAARRNSVRYLASRWLARHPVLAVSVVFLLGYAMTATWSTVRVAGERDTARAAAQRAEAVTSFLERLFQEANPRVSGRQNLTARDLLERAPARIESELAGQEDVQSVLFRLTGTLLQDLGDEQAAEPFLNRSLALAEGLDGRDDPPLLLASLRSLAGLYTAQVREKEAFALLDRAEAGVGAVTPQARLLEKARNLEARGQTLFSLGRFDEALTTYTSAVSAYEEIDEVDPRLLARARSRRADAHRRSPMDTNRSIELLEETVVEYRKVYGARHPEVPRVLKNLAAALGSRGLNARREDPDAGNEDLKRVRQLLGEALEISREAFGENHPSIAQVHRLLGASAWAEEDWPEVAAQYGRAQTIYRSLSGHGEDAASAEMYVGVAAREQGDLEAARATLLSSLSSLEELAGAEHHLLAPVLFQLGETSRRAGSLERAAREYTRAYEILLATRGPKARLSRFTHQALLDTYLAQCRERLDREKRQLASEACDRAATLLEDSAESDEDRRSRLSELEQAIAIADGD